MPEATDTSDASAPTYTPKPPPTYRSSLDVHREREGLEGDPDESPTSYEDRTKAELQEDLSARGLPTSGNKGELVDRLKDDDHGHTH